MYNKLQEKNNVTPFNLLHRTSRYVKILSLTISILIPAFFPSERVHINLNDSNVKLMEYRCISTKLEWTRKSSRVYDILTHGENLSIREEMDTKTRIYTRATKIDEVNIIADFRTPRNTRFMSLKSVMYVHIRPYISGYAFRMWFISLSYLIVHLSCINVPSLLWTARLNLYL